MDVAAMSSIMSLAQVKQQASLSVTKMTMDVAKENAAMMTQMISDTARMMERSVTPHLGGSVDIRL